MFFVSFHYDLIVCPLMHLQKLPFTIPELVQSAPCRSSDGILYTGECVFVLMSSITEEIADLKQCSRWSDSGNCDIQPCVLQLLGIIDVYCLFWEFYGFFSM